MKFKKGSAAAKAYMAKIRAKRKTAKKAVKKSATKKRAVKKTTKTSSHKDTGSHNTKITVMSGINQASSVLMNKFGKLSVKKLTAKTKTEKNKIAKEMRHTAAKLRKLATFKP